MFLLRRSPSPPLELPEDLLLRSRALSAVPVAAGGPGDGIENMLDLGEKIGECKP